MSKHTPGEWKVKHSESKPAFNIVGTKVGGKYKLARCPYTDGVEWDKAEAEANAKKMAAAPELFEALKAAHRALIEISPQAYEHTSLKPQIEAAIKKATE